MQSSPLVSIIIPAYNQAAFLAETIESVLAQGYAQTEIIVLDDGSTDGTPAVIAAFQDRVTAYRHDNIGENPTVNRGLELAQGDILCIVNADDPLLPGAIEAGVAALEGDSRALAAYPDWVEIDPHGQVTRLLRLPDYDLAGMLLGFNVAVGPGVFLRREALDQVGKRNTELRYTGDLDYWFRVALVGGLRHIPAVLATHRVHPQAASSAAQGKLMADEVLRLVKVTLRNSSFPGELRRHRFQMLRQAHAAAAHYCGDDSAARSHYLWRAAWYQHAATWHARLTGLRLPAFSGSPQIEQPAKPAAYTDLAQCKLASVKGIWTETSAGA